jgi:hypothetical protein
MTKKQLQVLLDEQGLGNIRPGYNYTMFCLKTTKPNVQRLATILRDNKSQIEKMYYDICGSTLHLLPYVCVPRTVSVLVPIPFGCYVNILADIISDLPIKGVKVPQWS